MSSGGFFDIEVKEKRLQELALSSENPELWNDHKQMQKINEEKILLERVVESWQGLSQKSEDFGLLFEMVVEEGDDKAFRDLEQDLKAAEREAEDLELKKMLSGELDSHSTYLCVNSGAGGTEACDWASMLLRMYVRFAEREGFKVELLEMTEGEGAGIKSATLHIQGPYAYGLLKAENGVHRLVRISPFDSNARRHTSFAAVFAYAEIDDEIEIEIKPDELNVDTYRSSGAGGQHINKTDSAVRITHIPTGIVVQCQNQRSQHANRDAAMKMLKAALYEREVEAREKVQKAAEAQKKAVEWGSQIRSYVMHPYQMVKDHRIDFETSDVGGVMDGKIESFVHAYLKASAKGEV